jgi:hypothetical protein
MAQALTPAPYSHAKNAKKPLGLSGKTHYVLVTESTPVKIAVRTPRAWLDEADGASEADTDSQRANRFVDSGSNASSVGRTSSR